MNPQIPKPIPAAVWDDIYEAWVVPWKCKCCEKCWLYMSGKRLHTCVHGGPYKGYVNVNPSEAGDSGPEADA